MKLTEFIKRYDELVERAIEIATEAGLGAPDDIEDVATTRPVSAGDEQVYIRWAHFEGGYYDDPGSMSAEESSSFPVGLLFAPKEEVVAWCAATVRAKEEARQRERASEQMRYALQERAREISELARLKAKYGG